jgi:asparagine synthase (glutamine-hydrolysing)
VNYCFGSEDAESVLAEQMAKHLGLSFQRIQDVSSGMDVEDVLKHAGSDYRTPFCDHSAIPTRVLARSVIRTFGSEYSVFEGTGADGAFGLFGRTRPWQILHSIPDAFLRIGSEGYRILRLWQKDSKGEYCLQLLRRATQHQFPLSVVAQNPLAEIAYHMQKDVYREVDALLVDWLHSLSPQDPQLMLCALDLSLVCACIFAQKATSLFASSQVNIIFPFLSHRIMQIALSSGKWQGADLEAKWLLKAALARYVPTEMVYRPKSGFVAPMSTKLKSDAFLAALEKLLVDKAVLSPFVEKHVLRNIRERLITQRRLPSQTTATVWAIVFVNEWLEQVTNAAKSAHAV